MYAEWYINRSVNNTVCIAALRVRAVELLVIYRGRTRVSGFSLNEGGSFYQKCRSISLGLSNTKEK